eukprot:Colp12_sorted_trinity150504_noHs@15252
MALLDKKKLEVPNIRDFSWSPSDNYISFWVPEEGNNPARVTVMQIPERKEIRTKNLFHVNDCKMHWQQEGDFLCVKVERFTKTKKTTFTNFELFRIREKQCPVDVVELKDSIQAFAWEPKGARFAVIHGDPSSRICVSFYKLEDIKDGGKVVLIKSKVAPAPDCTLEKKNVNHLFWSPTGRYIILAGLRNMNGVLEFWDVDELVCMNTGEHFMATNVSWDPTGRYVATFVSFLQYQNENGYNIWTFQGRSMTRKPMERFYRFLWRPRPKTLLPKEQIKKIKKNLKSYSSVFDRIDSLSSSKMSKELLEKRQKLIQTYDAYRQQRHDQFLKEKAERVALRGGMQSDDEDDYIEETEVVETLVKEEVETVGN